MSNKTEDCPLKREEKWRLVNTVDDQLVVEFPDFTRSDLRRWKRQLSRGKLGLLLYLVKGRTEQEMGKKFSKWKKYLDEGYDGYNLFISRNQYNERVYILLPVPRTDVTVKKRDFSYHVAQVNGQKQPYIIVQMPKKAFGEGGMIRVVPLFDVHYGQRGHRHEKFLSYLRWIEETPNIYVVVGGDLMENALDDNRGMSYDQDENPMSQLETMVKLLAPIAHKIILMTPGNHEWRTYKRAGIDPMAVIARELNVPYFSGPALVDVLAKGYRWTIHVFHGRTGSQTKGGKLNAAGRPRRFTGMVHFYLSGHTHDPMVNSETIIIPDPVNCRLIYPQQWTVVAQSFLRWEETYAYRANYPPPGSGGVTIELYDNGEYRATQV